MNVNLQEQYIACCQAYADLLLKHMGKSWADAHWVKGIVGSVLDISGVCVFSMTEIRYIIDNDMPASEVMAWHDYNVRASMVELFYIDIDAWHHGATHVSPEDMALLLDLKQEMLKAIEEEGSDSPNYFNARTTFNIANERILNSIHIYKSKGN